MTARCTGEPVSWLRLERFHLQEIQGSERASIAAHLERCAACAGCLAHIADDDACALPPLSLSRAASPSKRLAPSKTRGHDVASLLTRRAAAAVGGLAAAAAIVLAVRGRGRSQDIASPTAPGGHIKGDAIAFSLVRDDGERVAGASGVYRDGDRFKAIVTCPPGAAFAFDVVVYDDGGASFPLGPAGDLACGNEVPIPGAFRITGDADETVCLVWREGGLVDRGELASRGAGEGHRLCKRLGAAP